MPDIDEKSNDRMNEMKYRKFQAPQDSRNDSNEKLPDLNKYIHSRLTLNSPFNVANASTSGIQTNKHRSALGKYDSNKMSNVPSTHRLLNQDSSGINVFRYTSVIASPKNETTSPFVHFKGTSTLSFKSVPLSEP